MNQDYIDTYAHHRDLETDYRAAREAEKDDWDEVEDNIKNKRSPDSELGISVGDYEETPNLQTIDYDLDVNVFEIMCGR